MSKIKFKNLFNQFVNTIGGIFGPVINLLCAAGLLKGILVILTTTGILLESDFTYQILSILGDAFFYFLPIFLAFTSANQLGCNPFTAVLISVFLVHPSLSSLLQQDTTTLFGLPVQNISYPSSVIPIVLAVVLLVYIEKGCNKILPEVLKGMFTPLISIIIVVPITLWILGPIGNSIANGITDTYQTVYAASPLIAMALLAASFPLLIMFGISTALAPVAINNLALSGSDTLLLALGTALFALAGASFAVYIRSKNKSVKTTALSATITALLGVGEPSVFGVCLPFKKPLITTIIAGGVGGAIMGAFNSQATVFLIPSIITLPALFGQPGYIGMFAGFSVSLILGFILTYLFTTEEAPIAM